MATKNVSLSISMPATMKELVAHRVEEENFGTPSEYIRSLVRSDLAHSRDVTAMEAYLQEGIDSGDAITMTSDELSAHLSCRLENNA